jgi:hypothetical protein
MPLYSFRCSDGHVTERLAGFDCRSTDCHICGTEAFRAEVNRIIPRMASPRGENVRHYLEAAETLEYKHDHTDDPVAQAATRPDVWRPAFYRSHAKLFEGNDRWHEPQPHSTDKEVNALS